MPAEDDMSQFVPEGETLPDLGMLRADDYSRPREVMQADHDTVARSWDWGLLHLGESLRQRPYVYWR